MDYNNILQKAKSLNNARHIIEDNINEMVTNAIEHRVKNNGFKNENNNCISHPIPSQFMVEVNSVDDSYCYIHEVYYVIGSKRLRVIGSWDICTQDEDENYALADLDLDEKIAILNSML